VDVCHVLFIRPWLFDRNVIHDSYQNTCSFIKDRKKITLTPLAPHQIPKTKPLKPTKTTEKLLTIVEADLKASHYELRPFKGWILQINSRHEESLNIPSSVRSNLDQYPRVFAKEISPGLQPKRSIQHHIDMIPEAIVPNKPAYRMNPKYTQEI